MVNSTLAVKAPAHVYWLQVVTWPRLTIAGWRGAVLLGACPAGHLGGGELAHV